MTIIIYKNNEIQKHFKKFFPCFITHEIMDWTENHFKAAKKKTVDLATKKIYIFL